MTEIEMIEQFQCPGCVAGSDTKCGSYESMGYGYATCKAHVLGTFVLGVGNFAIGLPKGFCKSGWIPNTDTSLSTMSIRCWVKGKKPEYDHFNVPVWALEKDGFLFVRVYLPRVNMTIVDIIEGGTLDMVPNAIDVSKFYDEMD